MPAEAAPAAVVSVSVPTNRVYLAGEGLDFVVNWDVPVVVNTNGGLPRLVLDIGGSNASAFYFQGNSTNALLFRYTILPADRDTNGIGIGPDLDWNGGTIQDLSSTDATTNLNNVGATAGVLVDGARPLATNDVYTVAEDTVLMGSSVLTNDFDANGDLLTAILVSAPTNGMVTLNPDGTFIFTPATNFNGSYVFTYKANDGSLDSTPATVTITVDPVNDAPVVVTQIPDKTATYGTPFSLRLDDAIYFRDVDFHTLNFQATNLPPGIVFNQFSLEFSGAPTNTGAYLVMVIAGDGQTPELFATNSFTITVGKATLRAVPVSKSRAVGEPNPPLVICYFGLAPGETEAVLDSKPVASTTAVLNSPPGSYPITLTGGSDDHYTLVLVPGVLVVRPPGVPPASGTYYGLFAEPAGLKLDQSGSIKMTTTDGTTFSASLKMGANRHNFSGTFDTIGRSTNLITRRGNFPLTVELEIGNCNSPSQIGGRLTDGAWVADLTAIRAVYGSTNPAPQAGNYNLIITGGDDVFAEPFGHSYGIVKVNTHGNVHYQGRLAIEANAAGDMVLTEDGQLPFYVSLQGGKGVIQGWLTFTNTPLSDISGQVTWVSPARGAKQLYPFGFETLRPVYGSRYLSPSGTNRLINVPSGSLIFGVSGFITNRILLSTKHKFTAPDGTVLPIHINPRTGQFSGFIIDPVGGEVLNFRGAFLQKTNLGAGYYNGIDVSGRVEYGP